MTYGARRHNRQRLAFAVLSHHNTPESVNGWRKFVVLPGMFPPSGRLNSSVRTELF
jgi:hypothetical protein